MNLSIYFTPRIILNKISCPFSIARHIIKSDGKSILFTAIIIVLLRGAINHQDYEYSYSTDLTNQNSKKISLFLNEKDGALKNLTNNSSGQTERTELIKSEIEMALSSHESRYSTLPIHSRY